MYGTVILILFQIILKVLQKFNNKKKKATATVACRSFMSDRKLKQDQAQSGRFNPDRFSTQVASHAQGKKKKSLMICPQIKITLILQDYKITMYYTQLAIIQIILREGASCHPLHTNALSLPLILQRQVCLYVFNPNWSHSYLNVGRIIAINIQPVSASEFDQIYHVLHIFLLLIAHVAHLVFTIWNYFRN